MVVLDSCMHTLILMYLISYSSNVMLLFFLKKKQNLP